MPAERPREIERLDVSQLGRLVREHRGNQSLRQAAADAGVSFSTMSRVEAGSQPDLASFTALCAWLGRPPSTFFTPVTARASDTIDDVLHHLHADPRLSPDAASAISNVLKEMYGNLAKAAAPGRPLIACHLRAAPVMRPGVPARLGALLEDLSAGLERLVEQGDL
jgi:transcriptional regulator with XRE-family HTH domain